MDVGQGRLQNVCDNSLSKKKRKFNFIFKCPQKKGKPSCNYPGLMHGSRLVSEVKFFYEVNETINFECYEGTRVKGNRSIKCISSGRWSGPIPECIPINMNLDQNDDNIDIYH